MRKQKQEKTRQVWALFAVGCRAHPQGLHQPCQAPGDTLGTSHRAGVRAGGSQPEVAGGKSCEGK